MKERIKENGKYLGLIFSLLILITFVKELVLYLNKSIQYFSHSIYAIFWIAIILLTLVYIIRKIDGIKPLEFIVVTVFAGFIISLVTFLLNPSVGTNELIEKNYIGIYGFSEEYDSQGESEYLIEWKTNVYRIGDNGAKIELRKLENKYDGASKREFLFWQTAFANGFKPKYISEYSGNSTFSQKITLFFTVGPLFIWECFIDAIMNSWILMTIPIIGILFNKKIFQKELKPFQNFIDKKFKTSAD